MSLLMVGAACGYDFPLSETAIRDAYFLGKNGPSQGSAFLAEYTHAVRELKVGACTSVADKRQRILSRKLFTPSKCLVRFGLWKAEVEEPYKRHDCGIVAF
jgi:hypothetical protein